MAIIYGLKVNLSVAIVAMIDHDEVARLAEKKMPNNVTLAVNDGHVGNITVDGEECVYEEATSATANETGESEVSSVWNTLIIEHQH